MQLSTSQAFRLNKDALEMPELQQRSPLGREARMVNMSELGKALTALDHPPVKAMVVYNSNPAAIAPNQNLVLKGMCREDLFTVVLEQFQTDTADHADILLPVTTFLEHTDLYLAYGHYYLQLARPALPAPGETKSNVEIFRLLAERIGFEDTMFSRFRRRHDPDSAQFRSSFRQRNHPGATGSRAFRPAEGRARRTTILCPSLKAGSAHLPANANFMPRRWIINRPRSRVWARRNCDRNFRSK